MNTTLRCILFISLNLGIVAYSSAATKPNFVFILADDMGWTGMSIQADKNREDSKSDYYLTPNLEKLASQGMSFSNAYAPAPMCTPSRGSILTGKSPAQLHMTTPGPATKAMATQKIQQPKHTNQLPSEEVTIAELLKKSGYSTAHFGKWHQGSGGPGKHGFDLHDGETENDGPGLYDDPNPKDMVGINARAMAFIEAQTKSNTPFYVQLSHYAVHSPTKYSKDAYNVLKDKAAGTNHNNRAFAAMTKDLDTSIGQLLEKIDTLGISANTYIIFMSDNGAPSKGKSTDNAPLSGGKGSLWEGGIRVPLIIRGPNVTPESYCDSPVIGYDLFPTFCAIANVTTSINNIEGTALTPLFSSPDKPLKRSDEALIFHSPHYGMGPKQVPQSAIRVGSKKLIFFYESNTARLYDLKVDIGETNDLATKQPAIASSLKKRLFDSLKAIGAQLPTQNPDFDISAKQSSSKSFFIKRMDKNGDNKVSKEEFAGPSHRFSQFDSNKDGYISEDEAPAGPPKKKIKG